jgi:tetratricopeptide (TPR) repeat protein
LVLFLQKKNKNLLALKNNKRKDFYTRCCATWRAARSQGFARSRTGASRAGLAEGNMNRKQRRAEMKLAKADSFAGVAALFNDALRHRQAGRLGAAERLFRQILALDPRHAGSLHWLGLIAWQGGRRDEAIDLFGRAVAANGADPTIHVNLGGVLRETGRLREAAACCREAIRLRPDFAEAHANLGEALAELGELDAAAEACLTAVALRPGFAGALVNLGIVLRKQGRLEDAVACCRRAIALQADFPPAYATLGALVQAQGRLDEAIGWYRRAIALQPDFADALSNLAAALKDAGQAEAAEASCRKAIALRPDMAEAHGTLGAALRALGRPGEAIDAYRTAIALNPDDPRTHSNLALALQDAGLLEAAAAACRQAIGLQPDFAQAHINLGAVLQELGRTEPAIAAYRHAIALNPEAADAHYNYAMARLAQGEFAVGWREYEWRWRAGAAGTPRQFPGYAPWLGESSLAHRTILVYAEQGYGDTLQFCRYVRRLGALGASVVLEVPAALRRLLGTLPAQLVTAGETLPAFDTHCPLMSLPLALDTRLETIPAETPYLAADPALAAGWRARLGQRTMKRAGLAWSGRETHGNDRNRSIPLAVLGGICRAGWDWISLQTEPRAGDRAALAARPEITCFAGALHDFAETAALIDALDLVITVDTAVAHLAGALGKTVWVLLPFAAEWRWLASRTDSPWYPTARLFRQPAPGDWGSVLAQVTRELDRLDAMPGAGG